VGKLGTRYGPYWRSAFSGKQYDERLTCLSCPLPDCVGREKAECPLRSAELERQRATDKAALEKVLRDFRMSAIVGRAMRRTNAAD
jgi:hypothetical protein